MSTLCAEKNDAVGSLGWHVEIKRLCEYRPWDDKSCVQACRYINVPYMPLMTTLWLRPGEMRFACTLASRANPRLRPPQSTATFPAGLSNPHNYSAMSSLLLLIIFAVLGSPSPVGSGSKTSPRQASWTVGQPVTVRSGTVRGAASRVRPEVSAYLGIPFAQPPTGQQRFMPPVAVTSFSSAANSTDNSTVFDASDFGPDCPSNHSMWPHRKEIHLLVLVVLRGLLHRNHCDFPKHSCSVLAVVF